MVTSKLNAMHSTSLLGASKTGRRHTPQFGFHPDTSVLRNIGCLTQDAVQSWAMVPCSWNGKTWWYGWASIVTPNGEQVDGWVLAPRDPRIKLQRLFDPC